jgi:hypothetical protein
LLLSDVDAKLDDTAEDVADNIPDIEVSEDDITVISSSQAGSEDTMPGMNGAPDTDTKPVDTPEAIEALSDEELLELLLSDVDAKLDDTAEDIANNIPDIEVSEEDTTVISSSQAGSEDTMPGMNGAPGADAESADTSLGTAFAPALLTAIGGGNSEEIAEKVREAQPEIEQIAAKFDNTAEDIANNIPDIEVSEDDTAVISSSQAGSEDTMPGMNGAPDADAKPADISGEIPDEEALTDEGTQPEIQPITNPSIKGDNTESIPSVEVTDPSVEVTDEERAEEQIVTNDTQETTDGNILHLINGDETDNNLFGGDNHDLIYGLGGNDFIYSSKGNDELYGDRGNDTLIADNGDDILYGGHGDDTLCGGHGDDTLYGGFGLDKLIGGGGDDILIGGIGNDILIGGQGADRFVISSDRGFDDVRDFSVEQGDTIDVSDLLGDIGYQPGVEFDPLDNYLRIEGNDLLIKNEDNPSNDGWDRIATADFSGQDLQGLLDSNSLITDIAAA